jgi:cyclic pyranopterin phosphate synthase
MSGLTHLDEQGAARMVDVSTKSPSTREATAVCQVSMRAETLALITTGTAKKGDVLATARIAGIMAAKRTSDLIPLCHPLPLSGAVIDLAPDAALPGITIRATVRTTANTGVEMEALTAASIAALTIYDMLKAADRAMRIEGLRVVHKSGGKSGTFEQD